jgi:catechol 2,3-dioxygenase-like lactoylglutathione lyase family enzyme
MRSASGAGAPRTRRRARLASCRVASAERPTIGAIPSNGMSNMSCSTKERRSAGVNLSSTTSSAGAQHVEAHARDHRGQPSAEVVDARGVGAAQSQPQVGSVLFEPPGQILAFVHRSSVTFPPPFRHSVDGRTANSVHVDDQEKALRFYTEVLGFVKKADFSQGSFRWLTVASPEDPDGTELQLALNDNPAARAYSHSGHAVDPLVGRGARRPQRFVGERRNREPRRKPQRGPASENEIAGQVRDALDVEAEEPESGLRLALRMVPGASWHGFPSRVEVVPVGKRRSPSRRGSGGLALNEHVFADFKYYFKSLRPDGVGPSKSHLGGAHHRRGIDAPLLVRIPSPPSTFAGSALQVSSGARSVDRIPHRSNPSQSVTSAIDSAGACSGIWQIRNRSPSSATP